MQHEISDLTRRRNFYDFISSFSLPNYSFNFPPEESLFTIFFMIGIRDSVPGQSTKNINI